MAQLMISWKIYTLAFILLAILFFIAPYIMEEYPRARNMPLPLLIVWWCEVILQGIAVLALISTVLPLYSLVWDALGWLTGNLAPTPTLTPTRLEDGPQVGDLAVPVPTAPVAATSPPKITATCKVGTIVLNVSVILPTVVVGAKHQPEGVD
ncbi:hypothetical protein K438DRAFT_1939945 [Mycena galopus ATCC 62051]|nr:hypothetical protein K438DRAFT_1939945 [Mycena galopus ATCC 62051]